MFSQAERKFSQKGLRDATRQPQLNFTQRAFHLRFGRCGSTKHAVDDRIQDRGTEVENPIAVQWCGTQEIEAGRDFQTVDELAVGKLVDADQVWTRRSCAARRTARHRNCVQTLRAATAELASVLCRRARDV